MILADLVTVAKGKKPLLIRQVAETTDVRLLQIEDLRPGASPRFVPAGSGLVLVEPRDVLLAWDGANAGTSSYGLTGAAGSTLAVLRPRGNRPIHSPYLGHFLKHQEGFLRRTCKGATVPHVDPSRLLGLDIPLPVLEEQQRVAAALEMASQLSANGRRSASRAEELRASLVSSLLESGTFPEVPLRDLAASGDRINYGVVQPGEHVDDGVPLVRVSDLRGGRVDRTRIKRISAEIDARYARSRIRGNEVLLSCVGTIGVVAVVGPDDVGSNIARAVTRIPIEDDDLRVFVAAYLSTGRAQNYFASELRTVSQPTLNGKQIGETLIPIPSRSSLLNFVRRVEAVRAIQDRMDEANKGIDNLILAMRGQFFGDSE